MASLKGWLATLLVLSAAAMSSVAGRFIVEKSSVRVLSPEHIRGHHDAAIANFGVPDYGGTMNGVVVYPGKGAIGCQTFENGPFKSKTKRPVILLLDRGDCYFALKAWNGQNAGAAAVLVADNIDEPLLTMDTPEETRDNEYVEKITIPSALIDRAFGEDLKKALAKGNEEVVVKLDWRESMPHPDNRVEYEFWTNSNDECGPRCEEQMSFVRNFKGHAQLLEKGGFTQFTPHYITWYCPEPFILSRQCKSQCINNGRYCAPDPEQDFGEGYDGKDIVNENLRQLCVHRVANESGRPWLWWDFVTDYHIRCSMKEKKYSRDCADKVVKSLGLSLDKISNRDLEEADGIDALLATGLWGLWLERNKRIFQFHAFSPTRVAQKIASTFFSWTAQPKAEDVLFSSMKQALLHLVQSGHGCFSDSSFDRLSIV